MNNMFSKNVEKKGANPGNKLTYNQAQAFVWHVTALSNEVLTGQYKAKQVGNAIEVEVNGKKVPIDKDHPYQSVVDSPMTGGDYSAWRIANPYVAKLKSSRGGRWGR